MTDKIILITGASDGIGKQAAFELAKTGAYVIMHGRNREKTEAAANWVRDMTKDANIDIVLADLASIKQIKQMSEHLHQRYDYLDVLVNNAGVQMHEFELSEDGFEKTFAINHLAYFLVCSYLVDLVAKSDYGRIVNVSSALHYRADLDFETILASEGYSLFSNYSTSKLCNVLFSNKLARDLKSFDITVNSIHPGLIDTHLNPRRSPETVARALPVEKGIISMIRAITDKELDNVTGRYLDSDGSLIDSSEMSNDEDLQQKLWDFTEDLIGESFHLPNTS